MKRTVSLLGALMFLTFCAYSQKKLIGTNNVAMDPSGAITFIDSNHYMYNSWEGSLNEHKPKYYYQGQIYFLAYTEPVIRFDTRKLYTGNSMPITLTLTWYNTIVDTLITVSEWDLERYTYQYDAAGNMINRKKYVYNGSTFVIDYEHNFQYNSNNDNTFVEAINHDTGWPVTERIDSLYYNTSNQLTRGVTYVTDGAGGFYASNQSILSYSGTILDYIKLYEGTTSNPLTWMYQADYSFVSGDLVNIEVHQVTGGVVQPSILFEFDFNYNANNDFVTLAGYQNGTPYNQSDYFYDAEGFLSKIIYQEWDTQSSSLFVSSIRDLYHQNTAEIDEVEMELATIYPNPASDHITISTVQKIEKVFIYDANGRLMLTQGKSEVDVSSMPAGFYRVMLKTDTGEAQGSFVKY